ncbi:hypothetical protein Tco_1189681 [Tanacetum coccineum]
MPYPRFTKVIINHFLKQHKSLSNLKYQYYHTIKDDGIVSRLKFVRIVEDYQEYRLVIPDVMMNDAIKQSESYQMFIKYSTSQISPKKSRGKGSQGKKIVDDSLETVEVSKESEPEPEYVSRKTASRRVVKKKVTISVANNIIPDPNVALELGKSISLTEAKEEEEAKQVHATHVRIVTEFVSESAKKKTDSRSSRSVVIQDTPNIMQALKESKKTRKRQPGTRGSSEGIGNIPGVSDESTVVSATSSERTGTKPWVPDEEKVITKEKVILEWGSEQESEYSEEDQLDDEEEDDKEDDETESDEDDIYKYKIRVRKDEDKEMLHAEVENSRNGDAEVSYAAKANAEKTKVAKDDSKKAKLPPTSSSLSVSSGFGDQFLKLSSDTSLIGTIKDTTNAEISALLYIKIQSDVPHIQSLSVLKVPVSVISEPTVLTPVQETSSAAPITTLPLPSLRVVKLEKDVFELKKIDHSAKALATLKSQVPTVVEQYQGSKIGDDLQKILQRHTADLIRKYSVKPTLKSSKIQTPTINLERESEKSASGILKIKKEQAEKQKMPKYTIKSIDKAALKELYHALMEALIEDENAIDKGVADTGKKTKRRRTKESESSKKPSSTKETPKGKALSKGSKTGKSASAKEPVEEPIVEVVMDDTGEDVVRDDDQPQDTSEP